MLTTQFSYPSLSLFRESPSIPGYYQGASFYYFHNTKNQKEKARIPERFDQSRKFKDLFITWILPNTGVISLETFQICLIGNLKLGEIMLFHCSLVETALLLAPVNCWTGTARKILKFRHFAFSRQNLLSKNVTSFFSISWTTQAFNYFF